MMTTTEYQKVHEWVRKHRGAPKKCEDCSTDSPRKTYDWANVSGEYRWELDDWKRLCRSCHKKFDAGRAGMFSGVRKSILVDGKLHYQMKLASLKSGRPLYEIVTEALEQCLDNNK